MNVGDNTDLVQQGREACAEGRWTEGYELFRKADALDALAPDDLERLSMCAELLGHDDEMVEALGRAHHAHQQADRLTRAARCAFWIGMRLLAMDRVGVATGWLGRAERLLESQDECAEQGYLLIPAIARLVAEGALDEARTLARRATEIGERFGDEDLIAMARQLLGRVCIHQGQTSEGLALFDEAMVLVTTGRLSPTVIGMVYCATILTCWRVYAYDRAREWTDELSRWWEVHPELVPFTGACMIHRSEILKLRGAWPEALEEVGRARARLSRGTDPRDHAAAVYQEAELLRLRGEYSRAEETYAEAARMGRDPQPGLALLRLAQERPEQAVAAIERALAPGGDPLDRTDLLAASVEIHLATDDVETAREACDALEALAEVHETTALQALAFRARGAVQLASDDAAGALDSLRKAADAWQSLNAPYEVARSRALLASACWMLGDSDGCEMEAEAARAAFESLGAELELRRMSVERGSDRASSKSTHGLTARELEVLRLVASGRTNKAIAAELTVSVKTVDRHVSNIFNKLDVSSRSEATAFAYQNGLV